jgi:hypothetical protein
MRVDNVTFANYHGTGGCGGAAGSGEYAIANHPHGTDAFHPHWFTNTNVQVRGWCGAVGGGGGVKGAGRSD